VAARRASALPNRQDGNSLCAAKLLPSPAGTWREAQRAKRALRKNIEISVPFCLIPHRLLVRPAGIVLRAQFSLLGARFACTGSVALLCALGALRALPHAVTEVTVRQSFLQVGTLRVYLSSISIPIPASCLPLTALRPQERATVLKLRSPVRAKGSPLPPNSARTSHARLL
jgi:hypothetical protein